MERRKVDVQMKSSSTMRKELKLSSADCGRGRPPQHHGGWGGAGCCCGALTMRQAAFSALARKFYTRFREGGEADAMRLQHKNCKYSAS